MPKLADLLQHLLDSDIDFVLIGGYAGVVHGSSLVTRDLDICAMLTPEQIEKLRAVLKDFHPRLRMTAEKLPFLTFPEHLQGIHNLYLDTDLGVLDVIGEVAGVGDFKRLARDAVEIDLRGRKCKVISLQDLIAAKEALGRDKDRAAVRELKVIQTNRERRG